MGRRSAPPEDRLREAISMMWGRLPAVRTDEGPDLRVDFLLPAASVEDAVMADTALEVMGLFRGPQVAAQTMRCDGLAGAADVVALALDGHQRRILDRAGIDRFAADSEAA